MEKSDPLLTVQDIHTYYGDSYVLQGISLKVWPGQIVALLGRNGMGKTTLIRSISGLTPPRRGAIIFKEHPISGLPPYEIGQFGMSLVPQGRRIFPSLTVRENLLVPTSALTGRKAKGNNHSQSWALETVLKEFPRLAERSNQFAGSLSGGEQQMLAIGRALMANPDLILMDEPSEGLSPMLVLQIEKIMKSLREQGRVGPLGGAKFWPRPVGGGRGAYHHFREDRLPWGSKRVGLRARNSRSPTGYFG